MARNLIHDHRVSAERADRFDALGGCPRLAAEMQPAIEDYFNTHVRSKEWPDYVFPSVNRNNIISGHPAVVPSIQKDSKLVRVLDLNGLGKVMHWARGQRKWGGTFDGLTNADDPSVQRWLERKMSRASYDQRVAFVSLVLDAINHYRKSWPYQPAWATSWAALKPFEREGPERWLQLLGMTRSAPRWLVLLNYTVRRVGILVRPTQFEAGWSAQHFPSPPNADLRTGGHPMDLRVSSMPGRLLPEYVHRQIDHDRDDIRNIDRTDRGFSGALADQRKAHHELLRAKYGPEVFDWMDNPL